MEVFFYLVFGLIALFCLYVFMSNKFNKVRKVQIKELERQKLEISNLQYKINSLETQSIKLNALERERQDLSQKFMEQKRISSSLSKKVETLEKISNDLKSTILEKDEFYKNLQKKDEDFVAKLTSMYSDFLLVQFSISENVLKSKTNPAWKEATRIKELKLTSKIYVEQFRRMTYKYEMLLQLFPELSIYVDDFESIRQLENLTSLDVLQEEFDRVQFFVSTEEYSKLSVNDRNQLALDRYIKGQKSKWQIGRDYELYCGLLYEKENWAVEYIGMEKKLNDLGRDLIAVKGNVHHIVQCKFWSHEKQIHEKHITQLYGTTVEYSMDKPADINIKPVFYTNIELTESAKRFAEKLGVVVHSRIPLNEFPRIKCNINRDEFGNESFIYHLPFDQQYDRTKISKKGEFYAYTVKEATQAGFRRAFKHFG